MITSRIWRNLIGPLNSLPSLNTVQSCVLRLGHYHQVAWVVIKLVVVYVVYYFSFLK